MVYSFYTEIKVRGSGIRRNTMIRKNKLRLTLTTALMTAALGFPALASERIEDITLEIESGIHAGEYGDGDYVDVIVDHEGCYLDTVTVTNVPGDIWETGDEPRLKIVLRTDEGYIFASGLGEDEVALDEETGIVTSVSRSSSRLTILVTLAELDEDDYYEYDEDYTLDVEEALWDSAVGGLAGWAGNDYARKYEVRLYKDGDEVGQTVTTEKLTYNFSGHFSGAGTYQFRVRAVRGEYDEGSWAVSDERTVSDEEAARIRSQAASTSHGYAAVDPAGTWLWQPEAGWWWCNPNRSYPYSVWAMIDGKWYYFNEQGYCVMNDWVTTGGKWYYCGESGAMVTSQMINGQYYVNINGEWVQ